MASAMRVFRKFRSADGRIKIATLSGVSVLVAVIALLVGVLPVFASHETSAVQPAPLDEGGGSGKCSVETGGLPSAASNEFHINNPMPGQSYTSTDGVVKVTVYATAQDEEPAGSLFRFDVNEGKTDVVYDVVVNGGPKSLHYDYDGNGAPVSSDLDLHAPAKNRKSLHNLSHTNVCYDAPGKVIFACDDPETLTGAALITSVTAETFANSLYDCTDKRAIYTLDDSQTPTVTLDFQGDGTTKVAGRLDFTKDFGDPTSAVALTYDRDDTGDFRVVRWCNVRANVGDDGPQFDTELGTSLYPTLDATLTDAAVKDTDDNAATACKVFEDLNADGIQHTVVYFEFVDPNFR